MEVKQVLRSKGPRGIGGVIKKQLAPLESNKKFLKKYSNLSMTILLNVIDSSHAAVVRFNKGKIDVESIENSNENALSKKVLLWDGMLQTTTPLFLKIAIGDISFLGMGVKMMSGKVKINGVGKLLKLRKMFALLL